VALEQLGSMTPPGSIAGQLARQKEAPDIRVRGSFIGPGDDFQTITIRGREYYITPVDPVTQRPYMLLQHEPLRVDDPDCANLHHGRHQLENYQLQDSLFPWDPNLKARKAERVATLQFVNPYDHNKIDPRTGRLNYHHYFYGTLPLATEKEIFEFIIPTIAGILPEYALDMRSGEPEVVVPTPAQLALMQTVRRPQPIHWKKREKIKAKAGNDYREIENPTTDEQTYVQERLQTYIDQSNASHGYPYQYFTFRSEEIRDFMQDYIFRQDINVADSEVAEFISERDADKKIFLGNKMLSRAVDAATLSIASVYEAAKRDGRLHQARPRTARGVVWSVLGRPDRNQLVPSQYAAALQEQYAVAA
jgi:hypothetical protein